MHVAAPSPEPTPAAGRDMHHETREAFASDRPTVSLLHYSNLTRPPALGASSCRSRPEHHDFRWVRAESSDALLNSMLCRVLARAPRRLGEPPGRGSVHFTPAARRSAAALPLPRTHCHSPAPRRLHPVANSLSSTSFGPASLVLCPEPNLLSLRSSVLRSPFQLQCLSSSIASVALPRPPLSLRLIRLPPPAQAPARHPAEPPNSPPAAIPGGAEDRARHEPPSPHRRPSAAH